MKTVLFSSFISVIFLLACAGCSATRPTQLDVGPETGSDAAIEARLEMLNPETVGTGNVRHVDLELRNTSGQRVECLVTADWFDPNGQPVPFVARRWIRIDIDAGGKKSLRFEPMPPSAQSFRLRYAPAKH
jgi:hypothetical protein